MTDRLAYHQDNNPNNQPMPGKPKHEKEAVQFCSSTELLLEKLSKAVSFQYPGKCAPGITISYLPNKTWYVSVTQYEDGPNDKKVIHKARNVSFEMALKNVAKQLLDSIVHEPNPLDDLHQMLDNV